ncbi:MAG: YtxH domain-containing protein [Ktedonobacteraceae bacterium]
MGHFTNGVLVGLGISLLFTPKKGEEMRNILAEGFKSLRGTSPENEALKQQVQEMAERVQESQQMAAQAAQMGSKVQSDLSNVAHMAGTDVPPTKSGPAESTRPNQSRRSTS